MCYVNVFIRPGALAVEARVRLHFPTRRWNSEKATVRSWKKDHNHLTRLELEKGERNGKTHLH